MISAKADTGSWVYVVAAEAGTGLSVYNMTCLLVCERGLVMRIRKYQRCLQRDRQAGIESDISKLLPLLIKVSLGTMLKSGYCKKKLFDIFTEIGVGHVQVVGKCGDVELWGKGVRYGCH